VLDAPAHLATKLAALLGRPGAVPGEKDREEVWLLLRTEAPDPGQVARVLGALALPGSAPTEAVDAALGYLRDLPLSRPDRACRRDGGRAIQMPQSMLYHARLTPAS
jgi:hypothetical protein